MLAHGMPGAAGSMANNSSPAPIVDHTYNGGAGKIVLAFSVRAVNPADPQNVTGPDGKPYPIRPYIKTSTNDGASWSAAEDISQVVPSGIGFFITGPGHGIQLASGRLALPVYETATENNTSGHRAAIVYSDEHGTRSSWKRGDFTTNAIGTTSVGESSIAQLPDGNLYLTARNNVAATSDDAAAGKNRVWARSTDDGGSLEFTEPQVALPGATSFASLLSLNSIADGDAYNQLVISQPVNPANYSIRAGLTLRSSFDNGATWQTPAEGLKITTGGSGYSDMARTASGGIGLIYEAGPNPALYTLPTSIRFTAVSASQIGMTGSSTVARTQDTAPNSGNEAMLSGAAHLTAGKVGRSVTLTPRSTAATGGVEVPPSTNYTQLRSDFTLAADFKYNSTTGTRAILWAFGQGAGSPQLWIRAEPASNRLVATAATTTGTVSLYSSQAYNDNAWHHVTLERTTTALSVELSLWVDGVEVYMAAAPSGAVSPARPQGIVVGNRLDGAQPFAGSIDDVVLYSRALTPSEINSGRTGSYSTTGQLLHIPFDTAEADTRAWEDIDGDGQMDVITRNASGGLRYFPGLGDVTTGSAMNRSLRTPETTGASTALSGAYRPVRGDFDNDGDADHVAISTTGLLQEWAGNGDGTFAANPQVLLPGTSFSATKALLAGDFNEDGLSDLGGVGSDGSVYWWAGNGDVTFVERQTLLSGTPLSAYSEMRSGDFNDDGRTDLVGLDANGAIWWWAGNGSGGLLTAQQLAPGISFASYNHLFTGDVDGNGKCDVIALDSAGGAHWWPSDGSGHLATSRTLATAPGSSLAGNTYIL